MRIVHTAIPPLANGSSQPSVFNVVGNLRALGYKPLVNLDALPPVREHFRGLPSARVCRWARRANTTKPGTAIRCRAA